MTQPDPCDFPDCKEASAASLENRPLCREHFLLACYARLETCERLLLERPFAEAAFGSVRQFTLECIKQVNAFADSAETQTNLERARVCDIMLWATELSQRIRRSPRKPLPIPVRLLSEEPGHPWEEDTVTRIVGRYGAALECEHPVRIGERLLVIRKDTGQRAWARVLFRHSKQPGRQEIGIELLDCETFGRWIGKLQRQPDDSLTDRRWDDEKRAAVSLGQAEEHSHGDTLNPSRPFELWQRTTSGVASQRAQGCSHGPPRGPHRRWEPAQQAHDQRK